MDEFTWAEWAGPLDKAAVTSSGRPVLSWAVDVLRDFFGETWPADNVAASGTQPLLHYEWYPLANPNCVVRVLELAARIAIVRGSSSTEELLREAREIWPKRELVVSKFQHLLLVLETAAFARADGWEVTYEKALQSKRKPDLWLSRNGVEYLVEITVLGFDREFRATERWTDQVWMALRAIDGEQHVDTVSRLDEVLDAESTAKLLSATREAARLTASDGESRSVCVGQTRIDVHPEGQRPSTAIGTGPLLGADMWRRVATRLREKVKQTKGGAPAWLRVDDVGALMKLTAWSASPLEDRLQQLVHNIDIALADAPHIRGVILSGGTGYVAPDVTGVTVWAGGGSKLLGIPASGPTRQHLGQGPAALVRTIPGRRGRLTFVVPTRHPHLLLPTGTGLEPGLWYHDEAAWLDRALRQLGHPPLEQIVA